MNERITKLEDQCWEDNPNTGPVVFNREKFAELIVRECIDQASIGNGHGNNQWDRALTFASNSIKDHFGVEE